jgi:hypothetical protein
LAILLQIVFVQLTISSLEAFDATEGKARPSGAGAIGIPRSDFAPKTLRHLAPKDVCFEIASVVAERFEDANRKWEFEVLLFRRHAPGAG